MSKAQDQSLSSPSLPRYPNAPVINLETALAGAKCELRSAAKRIRCSLQREMVRCRGKKSENKHSEQDWLTSVTAQIQPRRHTMKRTGVECATNDHHHRHAVTIWLATFCFYFLLEDVCEAGNVRTSRLLGCLLLSERRCSCARVRARMSFKL